MLLKRAENCQTTQWSGGKTTELYIFPEKSSYLEKNFDFRFSFATVDVKLSKFTSLPGYKRILMPLSNSIELNNGKQDTTIQVGNAYEFDGGTPIESKGISTDVNVMLNHEFNGQISLIEEENKVVKTSMDYIGVFNLGSEIELELKNEKLVLFPKDCVIIDNANGENLNVNLNVVGDVKRIILFEVKKGDEAV
ncbi:HutD family protein [Liquorilactobacillus uvarum]|uniref:HutD-family protein n=1 Tax=Liquorilactobacillus uvarum DSM 19971 TaxID=1423812 RepID=A0A0R1Q5E9_9LACO|nr:HutD family protein [Liquorilactobacillus uvarum]KRL36427.1 hypothetical protein FD20_GL001280 [Liquorilactobacillus uvarum DSM 19971]